jgi:hypothetical protein
MMIFIIIQYREFTALAAMQKRVLKTKIIPIVSLYIRMWMILPGKNDLKYSNVICT